MVDLVAGPVGVGLMGLVVLNGQEYPHYSGVNAALWVTEMGRYLGVHVAGVVVEDGRSLMTGVVAVVVDRPSKN